MWRLQVETDCGIGWCIIFNMKHVHFNRRFHKVSWNNFLNKIYTRQPIDFDKTKTISRTMTGNPAGEFSVDCVLWTVAFNGHSTSAERTIEIIRNNCHPTDKMMGGSHRSTFICLNFWQSGIRWMRLYMVWTIKKASSDTHSWIIILNCVKCFGLKIV